MPNPTRQAIGFPPVFGRRNRISDFLSALTDPEGRSARIFPGWPADIAKWPTQYRQAGGDDPVCALLECVNRTSQDIPVSEALWWRHVLADAIRLVRYGEALPSAVADAIFKDVNHQRLNEREQELVRKHYEATNRTGKVGLPDQTPQDTAQGTKDTARFMVLGAAIEMLFVSGALARTHHCAANCPKFFVGRDRHQRYCSEECKKRSRKPDRRKRAAYMKDWRQNPRVKARQV